MGMIVWKSSVLLAEAAVEMAVTPPPPRSEHQDEGIRGC